MSRILMRRPEPGEIPHDGPTAVQRAPEEPVFKGTGGDDYVCVECGNVLASAMAPEYMNRKLRVKCARCRTINVAIEVDGVDYAKAFTRRPGG
jgi:phage FluMu protein Com